MAASMLLGGDAASWFEPKIKDFIENEPRYRDSDTVEIYGDLDKFFLHVKSVYGEPDKNTEAEREFQCLRQTGSATEYLIQFQQITSRLNLGEDALYMLYR